ncbi:hypothetical protein H2248_004202 [Termitomyces sp. 'cryptogamus']|nr:hypothetical protein H2248_004202 [Termitomyces sp. 'cryptogamus']
MPAINRLPRVSTSQCQQSVLCHSKCQLSCIMVRRPRSSRMTYQLRPLKILQPAYIGAQLMSFAQNESRNTLNSYYDNFLLHPPTAYQANLKLSLMFQSRRSRTSTHPPLAANADQLAGHEQELQAKDLQAVPFLKAASMQNLTANRIELMGLYKRLTEANALL